MTTKKTASPRQSLTVPARQLERRIYTVRDQNVMLDSDLAELYGVDTRTFNQAIKRHAQRFPSDFMFHLSANELESLRSQSVISNLRSQIVISDAESETNDASLRSQIGISNKRRGGRRYLPYVFTE